MNHPELAGKIEQLGFYLKYDACLPRPVFQFIVLSMAARYKVAFEWVDHVAPARAAGLPEAVIQSLIDDNPSALPSEFSVIARAMDAILSYRSLPSALQDIRLYQTKGLIEIVTLCGFHQLIGVINQSFDVPLPEGAADPFAKKG